MRGHRSPGGVAGLGAGGFAGRGAEQEESQVVRQDGSGEDSRFSHCSDIKEEYYCLFPHITYHDHDVEISVGRYHMLCTLDSI